MKGAIMLSGGGGSGKLFAAIGVTYPKGSTVTCTNGTKTLTAKPKSDSDTQWVFAIPEPGTWTVTATDKADSSKTRSASFEITKENQWESVMFEFALDIIKNGYAKVQFDLAVDPIEDYEDGVYYCDEARYSVDVTNYSALKFEGRYHIYQMGYGNPELQVINASGVVKAKQTLTRDKQSYTIDLSAITGVVQIYWKGMGYTHDTQGWQGTTPVFYNMWL